MRSSTWSRMTARSLRNPFANSNAFGVLEARLPSSLARSCTAGVRSFNVWLSASPASVPSLKLDTTPSMNAFPKLSWSSPNATLTRSIWPWKVPALTAACPPNVSASCFVMTSMSPVFRVALSRPAPSRDSPPVFPSNALPKAWTTESSERPVPPATSRLKARSLFASSTLPTLRTSRSNAGRRRSSATPV